MMRATLIATVVTCTVAASGALAVTGPATAQAAAGPSVSVYETTANKTQLLAPQAGTAFAPGASSASQTITVNPATKYQSMTGFGASFTDSSAWLVANSPQRTTIMTKLFDPTNGIGLSFLRQPLGASDFSRSTYSFDDVPAGQTDPTLAKFSIAHDNDYILPILKQALALNPKLTVMGTPWSPPGWMKSSGSMVGGTLNSANDQTFANYLVKSIQAYQAAGVPISLISAQNEPRFSPSNYPGSTLTDAQETSFIGNNLGPAIAAAGLSTKILGYDHNWDDPGYPETILGNATANQYTAGTAWHCYAGDPSAQTTVHNAYPGKDTYFTECSGSQSANTANTFSDSLDWQTENLIIGATRNWAKSVVTWNMALDPSGGPSMNCTTCTAAVTVDNGAGTAAYNAEYYSLGQASKFVKPGAVRIDSNTFGAGNVEDVAFKNTDGSTAMVVLNASGSAQTFGVSENGQSFTYSLPSKAVATFSWPTDPTTSTGGGGGTTTIDSTKWYQVVNQGSSKCLDDAGWATANGTALQQWTCAAPAATNEEWQFRATSNGNYQVVNRNASSLTWNVTGSGTADGSKVQLWSYGGAANEQFKPVLQSNGDYEFVDLNSGKCLDNTGGTTTDGIQQQVWTCTGGPNQSFALIPQP